ncbi:MAG: LysR family transcriptional regulator [Pseudomonadota bacterium]
MIGSLTLDQLRVLVSVAEEGSFSAAARALGRSQSVVSQTIANLEGIQGVTLFDRSAYRPTPTESGRVLITRARAVVAAANQFEAVAAGMRSGLEPELALAIDPLVPSPRLMEALKDLRRTYPDLPVSFSTEGLGGALRRLREDTVSLAVCLLIPDVPADVVAHPIMRMSMRAVVAPDHPLSALNRPLTETDLLPHTQLILADPNDSGRPGFGVLGTQHWRFVDLTRRLDFLLAGFGWCRMPDHIVAPYVAAGRLVEIEIARDDVNAKDIPVYVAQRADRTLGPAGKWLLDRFVEDLPAPTA